MKIKVDEQIVDIEDKPFTLLVHEGQMDVEALDTMLIGPEETLQCTKELASVPAMWSLIRAHENFLRYWTIVWKEVPPPEDIGKASMALRHVAGMIILMMEAIVNKKNIHLKFPESYLHPKQCANVTDMIITMQGTKQ